MNTSGEAADQVVRMVLEGTEYVVRLSGKGAVQLGALVYSIARQQKKTKGAERLTNMLRNGKALKVYTFDAKDLTKFKEVANQYGVLYTILKEKERSDGVFDVLVRAEDDSKITRIVERFKLVRVDSASIRADVVKRKPSANRRKREKRQTGTNLPNPNRKHPKKAMRIVCWTNWRKSRRTGRRQNPKTLRRLGRRFPRRGRTVFRPSQNPKPSRLRLRTEKTENLNSARP